MKKVLPCIFVILSLPVWGQQQYSLGDIIMKAYAGSSSYRLAKIQQELSRNQYLSYTSELKPQISFYGNAPVFNKEYFEVRQPDGSIKYQSISQNNANIGLGLSQKLPFSGGDISLNTEINRFDDFKSGTSQYAGTPVYLRLSQPLFAVNALKWRKRIEPLKLQESGKTYALELENIALRSVQLFFDVLDAEINIDIARTNLRNATLNIELERKRIILGTTTEDKLLQLELQTLRNEQELKKAQSNRQIAQMNLRIFLGLKDEKELPLSPPEQVPQLNVDISSAFGYAKKSRPEFIAFQRKIREARRDVAVAKAEKYQVNLVASYGLNNTSDELGKLYDAPNDQQRLNVGFHIPIVDWGRRNARYNTAKAIEKLVATTNELDEAAIYQEIATLVRNIELLRSNIALAKKADSVGQRRFAISNSLYQIGKLSITELYLAQTERDNGRRTYISALRDFWSSYYTLRKLTLYDFEAGEPLSREL
ncbi:TolC family protein [Chitinophaga cymbidii]|uniref:Membrane protein n=1 Tax=Chitinophaga cymbidii TaxID=1096750 RepID=A0A512RQY2_9BACT|nr:TolC family protein [Chitinophaga cymbidii]GEP98090.1 membrane protein [Chitinophaga cymbidii]